MKVLVNFVTFFLLATNALASENACVKNEQEGVTLVAQAIAQQLIGTAIYNEDFNVKVYHKTFEGSEILSVSGMVVHQGKLYSVHGLVECNQATGSYELAGAGTSSK